jgi:hypothetical protein
MTVELPRQVRDYVDAIVEACTSGRPPLVSVIVFGSSVTGGFVPSASDVDMILVMADGALREERRRLRVTLARAEALHGLQGATERGALGRFAQRVTANVRSSFICTRSDLLSGDVARILGISAFQAFFVDRAVVPSITGSAVTVWGEDLLPRVPSLPIRRIDVFKSFFGLWNQVLLTVALYPFVPSATKYAMGALKRSVHNCYFCYHLRPESLDREIAFFQERLGRDRALEDLVALRVHYRRSFRFVLRCLPGLARLHLRTAMDNSFPRPLPDAR